MTSVPSRSLSIFSSELNRSATVTANFVCGEMTVASQSGASVLCGDDVEFDSPTGAFDDEAGLSSISNSLGSDLLPVVEGESVGVGVGELVFIEEVSGADISLGSPGTP